MFYIRMSFSWNKSRGAVLYKGSSCSHILPSVHGIWHSTSSVFTQNEFYYQKYWCTMCMIMMMASNFYLLRTFTSHLRKLLIDIHCFIYWMYNFVILQVYLDIARKLCWCITHKIKNLIKQPHYINFVNLDNQYILSVKLFGFMVFGW